MSHPEITHVYIRSDNASCYKSIQTIVALWLLRDSIPGLTIVGYWFSEAGGGKSRCDTVSVFQMVLSWFLLSDIILLFE